MGQPTEERSREEQLNQALHTMLDENDALRAELATVKGRLDALTSAFDDNGALGVLQRIAHDASMPADLRVKAATAAVGYEKAKPPSTSNVKVFSLFHTLEAARLKGIEEREAKAKTIEHSAPPLASDHGGDPLGPDPAA
jgi:hypothetical protein